MAQAVEPSKHNALSANITAPVEEGREGGRVYTFELIPAVLSADGGLVQHLLVHHLMGGESEQRKTTSKSRNTFKF
jgi:hypothetical protein